MKARRTVTGLWIEQGRKGLYRVVMGYQSHLPRTARRTNTLIAAEAELVGLARRHNLKTIEPTSGSFYLSATKRMVRTETRGQARARLICRDLR